MDDPRDAAAGPAESAPTPPAKETHGPPPQMKLELGGGGWVLIVAGFLGLYLLLKLTWPLLSGQAKPQPLQQTPAEMGFDLNESLIPVEQIITAAPPDSIPPLSMPKTVAGAEAAAITKEYRRKYHHKFVVTGDRVIGVSINGESRAYQLKILQWHEVVNDVLGGVPIAVTYSPLTDSVAVYDRRVGDDVLVFAASGLLYNSNSLLCESERPRDESSLWVQLGGQAVSGYAKGGQLTPLPCELTHWGNWLARHPDTTMLSTETGHNRKYTINAYGAYFNRMKLRFPLDPAPQGNQVEQFTRAVAVQQTDGSWRSYTYPEIKMQPERDGLRFVYEPFGAGIEPDSVRIEGGAQQPVVYGLQFALEAFGYMD